MRSLLVAVLFFVVACSGVPIEDCPTYFQQGNEAFDQQKWDAMAACAKGLKGQELADYLNNHQDFFKAKYGGPGAQGGVMPRLVLTKEERSKYRAVTLSDYDDTPIPKEYNVGTAHPECADVVGHITNQGLCGDCWAHGSTGVMSDRICLKSNGAQKVDLSPYELLTCCENCTVHPPDFDDRDHKCAYGSWPINAFNYWISQGIVTEQCQPVNSKLNTTDDPKCVAKCVDSEDFQGNKHYGANAYRVGESWDQSTPELIQRELMANGSVTAVFDIYEDFYLYQSGIYIPASDKTPGGHVVRIVGWGEERGIPYWLVANSWGTELQENGFFRILRGTNAADFEAVVDAGTPKI